MAGTTVILCLVLLGTAIVLSEKVSFRGYELLSVFAKNAADVDLLRELGETYPKIDFWLEPGVQKNSTVLVPPEFLEEFLKKASNVEMPIQVLSEDVQSMVDAGYEHTPNNIVQGRRLASGQVIDHYNYHTYDKIRYYLNRLAEKYCNIKVSKLKYLTYEGKSVAVVKLTGSAGTNKPVIIIEAGIHAREWISPAANLWFIEKVLQDYAAGDSTARSMLDKYDWYIVPVTNPDGYDYTHSTHRLWRKNRRYINGGCEGVDLNRNFDVMFGTTGVSHKCDNEIYAGPSAFSEAESSNIRDLFNSLINKVVAYVSVHSYSQVVLVPWGYTNYISRPANQVELDRVTKLMTAAISNKHGKFYQHGTAKQVLGSNVYPDKLHTHFSELVRDPGIKGTLKTDRACQYPASGSSTDWALTKKNENLYSLAFELRPGRDAGRGGFILPASQIIPTAEEYYASLVVLAKEMRT